MAAAAQMVGSGGSAALVTPLFACSQDYVMRVCIRTAVTGERVLKAVADWQVIDSSFYLGNLNDGRVSKEV